MVMRRAKRNSSQMMRTESTVARAVAQSFGFGPGRPARNQSACATTARLKNMSGNSA